jgi:thymidylate synthase (FAD)
MLEKQVLDRGWVKLLNVSGAVARQEFEQVDGKVTSIKKFDSEDIDPALVARTSFNKGMKEYTKEQDEGLVEFLMRDGHNTPVEFTTIYLEFKMPIFVARQVMRHRTASINEVSGRYVTLPKDWYIPEVVRGKHSGGNKQGSEDNLTKEIQTIFKEQLQNACLFSYDSYVEALEVGICPEQARMFLHLNHYTQFVWKQDLHNLMHFLSLRLDDHAQWEVRQYAEAIYELLKVHLPKSMEWFDTYRRKLEQTEKETLLQLYHYLVTSDNPLADNLEPLAKLLKRQGLKV